MNSNSIRNKFDSLADINEGNIDILMISESKLDTNFETAIRPDWDRNSRAIVLFIRNGIHSKVVSTDDKPIESFYVEL